MGEGKAKEQGGKNFQGQDSLEGHREEENRCGGRERRLFPRTSEFPGTASMWTPEGMLPLDLAKESSGRMDKKRAKINI